MTTKKDEQFLSFTEREHTQHMQVVILMDKEEQLRHLENAKYACLLRIQEYKSTANLSGAGVTQCPVVWDNILCWSAAPPSTVQTQSCPDYLHKFDTWQNATRVCTENGTWYVNPNTSKPWTNYSACIGPPSTKPNISEFIAIGDSLRKVYTVGYGISLGSLIIAVVIMCCCKRLKSKSNTLHVNLFLAYILRAALSFAKEVLFVQDLGLEKNIQRVSDGRLEFIENSTYWECRTLYAVFIYSIYVSQMWIFMEGLYLHMLIYSTLSTERRGVRVYVVMGWISPLLCFIPWVIAKSTLDNIHCWTIPSKPHLIWILDGPMMTTVIVNFIFFLNILRVLISRVRSAERHIGRQQYRRLAKFILVLVPLFGVFYIIFYIVFPMSVSSAQPDVRKLYIEMAYNSFQGFILALLFCFLNEEVHAEIRRMWMRKKSLRRDSVALTRSFGLSSVRKTSFRSTRPIPGSANGRTNNNHAPNVTRSDLHLTRAYSDSSSDAKSDDWLTRVKRRTLGIFQKTKSNSSSEMIDTRYDFDGIPDIDSDNYALNHGVSVADRDHSSSDKNEYYDTEK